MEVFHFVAVPCIRNVSCDHVRQDSGWGLFSPWGLGLVGEGVQFALCNPQMATKSKECWRLDPQASHPSAEEDRPQPQQEVLEESIGQR